MLRLRLRLDDHFLAANFQVTGPQFRRIPVPPHRYTPTKEAWMQLYTPVVEHMKLQIRMNVRARQVEIKVSRVSRMTRNTDRCLSWRRKGSHMNRRGASRMLQTCDETEEMSALQKAADFIRAFMLGFEIQDAIALLRLDDLYLDSFDITDGTATLPRGLCPACRVLACGCVPSVRRGKGIPAL